MITLTSLSFGEILEKAGLNTLLGMLVVFFVLILISLLIYCLRFIPMAIDAIAAKMAARRAAKQRTENKKDAQSGLEASGSAQVSESPVPTAAVTEQPDLALIAVITAAIAAETNMPADGIVIRSIRRASKNNWKRA